MSRSLSAQQLIGMGVAIVALSVDTLRTRQVMAEDGEPVVLEPPVDEHAAAKPP